jgi:Tetratricopeptide Repeats-Sensor
MQPYPSYHVPFERARQAGRSDKVDERSRAIEDLKELRRTYPHVLAIGQELVLALLQQGSRDEAERELLALDQRFNSLVEETQCRWGRLFKDRGDEFVLLPWSPEGRVSDPDMAQILYQKSLARYQTAYGIEAGHFPGINVATLNLIIGALMQAKPGESPPEIAAAESMAANLLATRRKWKSTTADDDSLWHPATAAEAHLLLRHWEDAAKQYRVALSSEKLTPHAREAMYRQVERICLCFQAVGVEIPPPLNQPATFFQTAPAPSGA